VKRRLISWLSILLTAALAYLAYTLWPEEDLNWALTSLFVMTLGLVLFYFRYERAKVSSKEMALIASLAAVAIVGRIVFAPFPNFKPTTYIVILAGFVFGPRAGFMVGSLAAFISNLFFGQGPWTPWQMLAWGLAGASAGWLGQWRQGRVSKWGLALFGFVWGFLFDWILSLWGWLSTVYPLNWTTWVLYISKGIPFDIAHASANVVFALLLTPSFLPILLRFRHKLTTTTISDTSPMSNSSTTEVQPDE
jgi:energy-coupling factor transport system substrate-specific component